ncbi:hypothetical protein DY000_02030091 [Brassica cretica]|uniref:Histidine kinase/HSP90-like ATPase domain-containing protein n=1 Tax=Brassica cretica TaxID=69181 RepID=A0ABQ7DS52_BRACR|nr:hypothetical protein DY000_02030091 [Brassica cretica]
MHGLMSYRRFGRARSLRSDRAGRTLRGDRPGRTLGRYVATERNGCSIATNFSFSSSDVLNVNFVVTDFDPNNTSASPLHGTGLGLPLSTIFIAFLERQGCDRIIFKTPVRLSKTSNYACPLHRTGLDLPLSIDFIATLEKLGNDQ